MDMQLRKPGGIIYLSMIYVLRPMEDFSLTTAASIMIGRNRVCVRAGDRCGDDAQDAGRTSLGRKLIATGLARGRCVLVSGRNPNHCRLKVHNLCCFHSAQTHDSPTKNTCWQLPCLTAPLSLHMIHCLNTKPLLNSTQVKVIQVIKVVCWKENEFASIKKINYVFFFVSFIFFLFFGPLWPYFLSPRLSLTGYLYLLSVNSAITNTVPRAPLFLYFHLV